MEQDIDIRKARVHFEQFTFPGTDYTVVVGRWLVDEVERLKQCVRSERDDLNETIQAIGDAIGLNHSPVMDREIIEFVGGLKARVVELDTEAQQLREQNANLTRKLASVAKALAGEEPECEPGIAVKKHVAGEPEWIVNDIGELGVRLGDQCFFLYKGGSIQYNRYDSDDDDGNRPMKIRPVYKREFGEVCHPRDWWPLCEACQRAMCRHPDRYEVGDGWELIPEGQGQ